MKFGLIDPARQKQTVIDAADLHAALRPAKLTPGATDIGTVRRPDLRRSGIAIVVAELGMFVPPESQQYFAIGRNLYAGSAVLFAFDDRGVTVDLAESFLPSVIWFRDHQGVETAIKIGTVIRPRIGMPGHTLWQWPGPRPSQAEREAFSAKMMEGGRDVIIDGDTVISTRGPQK